jgi:hypothetical protein
MARKKHPEADAPVYVSYDPARRDGDYSAVCIHERGADGVVRIVDLCAWVRNDGKLIGCYQCGMIHQEGQLCGCPVKETPVIFEYLIVEHPTPKDKEKGVKERLITEEVKLIVAKDLENAKTLALIQMGKDASLADYDDQRVEVIVRPFK